MKITNISIRNFRGIDILDFEPAEGVNVIAGVNGAGKSSVLRAIEILMSWLTAKLRQKNGKGLRPVDDDITNGKSYCMLSITLDNEVSWTIVLPRSTTRSKVIPKSDLKSLSNFADSYIESHTVDGNVTECPLWTLYGVRRAVNSTPIKVHKAHALSALDAYEQNTESQNNFHSFFLWFRELEDIENEHIRNDRDYRNPQLQAVRAAIATTFPNFGPLTVKRTSPMGFYLPKDGQSIRFNQLSDGEKIYIGLVADIARKLAMSHPEDEHPLEVGGVILIDEADLHLHPTWQRLLLPKLKEVFPNCQFILTTHSPFIITNIQTSERDLLMTIGNGVGRIVPENVYGQKTNLLLSTIFQLPSLRAPEVQQKIDIVYKHLGDGTEGSEEYVQAFNWLTEHVDPNDEVFQYIHLQRQLNELDR